MAWRDGTVHLAEIVEIRKAGGDSDTATTATATPTSTDNGTGGGAGAPAGAAGSSEGGGSESSAGGGAGAGGGVGVTGSVYVHYVDFDRRLDEWVDMERVDLAAGQQRAVALHNGDKRRVTTRMKRELFEFGPLSCRVTTLLQADYKAAVGRIALHSSFFPAFVRFFVYFFFCFLFARVSRSGSSVKPS